MSFQYTDAMPPTNLPPVNSSNRPAQPEPLRLTATGSPWAVQAFIKSLHHFDYAEPNDWSKPQPTGRPGEVIVVLIKKVMRDHS